MNKKTFYKIILCKPFIFAGMFGKIATPPNGTVFILIILVVLALFFGNHYSICTEDIVDLSKKKRQIQFLELGFVLCWPAILRFWYLKKYALSRLLPKSGARANSSECTKYTN